MPQEALGVHQEVEVSGGSYGSALHDVQVHRQGNVATRRERGDGVVEGGTVGNDAGAPDRPLVDALQDAVGHAARDADVVGVHPELHCVPSSTERITCSRRRASGRTMTRSTVRPWLNETRISRAAGYHKATYSWTYRVE